MDEVIRNMPKEKVPEAIGKVIMEASSFSGPIPPQIIKKIDKEHIDKALTIAQESNKNEYELAKSSINKNFIFSMTIIGVFVCVFIFLTVYLSKGFSDLYKQIIQIIVAFLGGFGAGKAFSKKN